MCMGWSMEGEPLSASVLTGGALQGQDRGGRGRLWGVAGDMHRTNDLLKKTTDSIRQPGRSAARPSRAGRALRGPPPGGRARRPSCAAAVPRCRAGCARSLRAAGMSAEAADREAATSSRPCTPPQTSWFEFVLEEALLEQHLQKPSPGACPAGRRLPAAWVRPGPAARPGPSRWGSIVPSFRGL